MNQEIIDALKKEKGPKFHDALLKHCRELVAMSRAQMAKHYGKWDETSKAYQAEFMIDRNRTNSSSPVKMSVPLIRAQVDSFVGFTVMLTTQRPKFYEMQATGPEDDQLVDVSERLLERDLQMSKFPALYRDFLKDVARYNLGVFHHTWKVKSRALPNVQPTVSDDAIKSTGQAAIVKTFEGNEISVISPFNWFPDTRLPIPQFQDGEFCAHELVLSEGYLKGMEKFGHVAGLNHVDKGTHAPWASERDKNTRLPGLQDLMTQADSKQYLVTCVQVTLIPSEFEIEDGKKLDAFDYPQKYLVWIANDSRIIRVEPMNYAHGEFTYDAGCYDTDSTTLLSPGLAEFIGPIQATTEWLMNSRMISVHKNLGKSMAWDPTVIDSASMESRTPDVKVRTSAAGSDLRRAILPLPLNDPTLTHIQDSKVLQDMAQQLTGITDNALGQYSPGRRSATEARAVGAGSSARLKSVVSSLWHSALQPLGLKLLMNHRQSISEEAYVKAVGQISVKVPWMAFRRPFVEIAASNDLFVFDGTLPTEKQYAAQQLQELLSIMLQTPDLIPAMGFNVAEVVRQIYILRGLTNVDRFFTPPGPSPATADGTQPGLPGAPSDNQAATGIPAQANSSAA